VTIAVLQPRAAAPSVPGKPARRTTVARWFIAVAFVLAIALQRVVTPDAAGEAGADAGGSLIAQAVWALIYVGALAGLLANAARAKLLLRRSPLVVAIVLLALISAAWSEDPLVTVRRAIGLMGTTAVAYYAVACLDLDEFVDAFATVVGIVAVASALIIAFLPEAGLMQEEYAGAWRGLFAHKNTFGLFLAIGTMTVLIQSVRLRGWKRLVSAGVALLCLVELAGSQSVTSILIAAAIAALIVAVRFAGLGRWQSRTVIACVLAGIIAIPLFVLANADALDGAVLFGRNLTLTGRTAIWPFVLQAIAARPVLGYGYDVFWADGGPYLQYLPAAVGWRPYHSHNGYLELALDLGIVGVSILAVALVRSLGSAWRFVTARFSLTRAWPLLALVYFGMLNLTESYIAKYNNFDWIVFVTAALYVAVAGDANGARVGQAGDRRTGSR